MADIPVDARPAAAVVLAQDDPSGDMAVFMVRRHSSSAFVPDVFVFPGGTVKDADRSAERRPELCAAVADGPVALGTGFRVAALRECFEEAGVLLARHGAVLLRVEDVAVARFAAYRGALHRRETDLAAIAIAEDLRLGTDLLLHWAHWITPEAWPIRFDTHFFLAGMPDGQQAAHDRLETTDGVWITPREALDRHELGTFPLVLATLHQLRDLAAHRSIAEASAFFVARPVQTVRPYVDQRNGVEVIVFPDHTADV